MISKVRRMRMKTRTRRRRMTMATPGMNTKSQ